MSMRNLTRKLFGSYKTTKMSSERPPAEFIKQISQNTGLQLPKLASKSRSKTPVFALDTNSPLWPRFYEKKVRTAHPHMSEADVKQQVLLLVKWRGQDRDKKRAREKERQKKTMRRGGKKSRRKSRSLLSLFY